MKALKNTIGLICLTMLLASCKDGDGEKTKSADVTNIVSDSFVSRCVKQHSFEKDGMEYSIYYQVEGGMHIVNHTKEQLEVELLQLQIDSLKNY